MLPLRNSSTEPHESYIDWLRVIGITVVVYGHSQGVPRPLYDFIYSFHMPLFFFISGLTLKPEKCKAGFWTFFRSISRSIIPPYLVFAAIGYLVWALVGRHHSTHASTSVPLIDPLVAIFYGSGTRNDQLQPVVLWFFPCLFSGLLLFYFISKATRGLRTLLSGLAFAAGLACSALVLPWEIETALLAVPFLWAGFEYRSLAQRSYRLRTIPVIAAVAIAPIAIYLSQVNGSVDLRKSAIGDPALFLTGAFLSIFCLVVLTRRLPASDLVMRISKSTVHIFPLHPHFFWAAAAFYIYVLGLPWMRRNPMVAVVASAVAIILITALSPWIGRVVDRFRRFLFRDNPAAVSHRKVQTST